MVDGLGFITVGDNRYAVEKLNPLEAIAFGNRVLRVAGPALGNMYEAVREGGDFGSVFCTAFAAYESAEVTALMTDALARCYTPRNEPMSNQVVLNSWFREHPGDLYHLGVRAMYELVKDFFPKQLATIASACKTIASDMAAARSPSPRDGKAGSGRDA